MKLLQIMILICSFFAGPVLSVEPIYGPTNPSESIRAQDTIRYFGSVVELKSEYEKEYRELHADVWEDVVKAIKASNIKNYHIFLAPIGEKKYLFSFFEYHGYDMDKDFAMMSNDATTREKWWPITDSYQEVILGTPEGQQWLALESLMHIK